MTTPLDIAIARLGDALRQHCPRARIADAAVPPFADPDDPRFALDLALPPGATLPELGRLEREIAHPGVALLRLDRWRPHTSTQPPGHYRLFGVAFADASALLAWRQAAADHDGPAIAHRLDLLTAPRSDAAPTPRGAILLNLLADARRRAMEADRLAPIALSLLHLGVAALSARLALPPRPTPDDRAAGAVLARAWTELAGSPPEPGGSADRPQLRLYGADPASGRDVHLALLAAPDRLADLPSPGHLLTRLLELSRGQFPDWLAPTQFLLLPIADRHAPRARELRDRLAASDARVDLAPPGTTMQARLRQALRRRQPWVLILGDQEIADGTVAVRHWQRGPLGPFDAADLPSLLEKPPVHLENGCFFVAPAVAAPFNSGK